MKKEEFGKKLQELRLLKGDSQQQLGELLKVGPRQIQKYEAGGVLPTHENLAVLCEHYKYDFISLLYGLKAKENGEAKKDNRYLALLEKNEIRNEKIIESQEADLKALRSAVAKITFTDKRVDKLEVTVNVLQDKFSNYEPMILGLREFVTEEIAGLKKISREAATAALGKKEEAHRKKA